MSPWPSSVSAPDWSRIVRESILLDTWNAIRVGIFALIRPVITSTDGRCVARIRCTPAARAFCARRAMSSSTFLPTIIIMSANSSMITTMYGSGSSGSAARFGISGFGLEQRIEQRLAGVLGVLHLLVEAGQVAHADRRHQLVAPLHLGDAPAQRVGRFLHVGDDRREQVRDALVDRELQHLRVDHDHAHVFRAGLVQQAQHHRVDRHRLAGTGRAGDQQMRHLGQVDDDRLAADILAQRERQRRLQLVVLVRTQDLGQIDDLAIGVLGISRPITVLPGITSTTRTLITDRPRAMSLSRLDTGLPDARRRLHLEARDHRAGIGADHLRVDAEILELEFDLARQHFEGFLGITRHLLLALRRAATSGGNSPRRGARQTAESAFPAARARSSSPAPAPARS